MHTSVTRLISFFAILASLDAGASTLAQDDVLIATGPVELNVQPLDDVTLTFTSGDDHAAADDSAKSQYWLGVQLAALPEVAKEQLGVEDGLAVEEVVADSPAAKAEIKRHDILIKAGDKPLKELSDLVKAVESSDGKELTITIVRGGRNQTVRVIAAKRPTADLKVDTWKSLRTKSPEIDAEIKRLEQALEGLKGKVGKEGAGLWFARPAVVAPKIDLKIPEFKFENWKTELPKDLSIQINKQGSEPAKIHVKRGDKEWDVTEDKLDDLPEDIRNHIKNMHGHMHLRGAVKISPPVPPAAPARIRAEARPVPAAPAAPAATRTAPVPPVPPTVRAFSARVDRDDDGADAKLDAILKKLNQIESGKLDQLDKTVKQLRKEIDELRTKSPGDRR